MSATYDCECDNFEMLEDQDVFTMNEGIPGPGVPAGGTAGQYLKKASSTDYDTEWDTLTAGDVVFNKESGYVSGTVGRYLQLLDSEDVQYTYGGEKELGTVGETLDYLADKSVEIGEDVDDLKNTLNHKADVIYDTASGDIASFPDGADGLPVKDLTVSIEPVQSGTGDPSPTNVRPISGWMGANVTRTGKNLLPMTVAEIKAANSGATWIGNKTTINNVEFEVLTDSGNNVTGIKANGIANANATLIVYGSNTTGAKDFSIASNTLISLGTSVSGVTGILWGPNGGYFTSDVQIAANDTIYGVGVRVNSGIQANVTMYPMIRLSTVSDATFDPYSGTTIPISWQSSAGTVYGGTLDVTTGVLTVDRIGFELSSTFKSWTQGSSNRYYYYDSTLLYVTSSNREYTAICDKLKGVGGWGDVSYSDMCIGGTYNASGISIKLNANTTMEEFTSWIDTEKPFVVSYLRDNVTYQLTPQEVTTLLGQNNIWADTGDSTVEYPCDTKLYIQKINTPTDDDMIADANIASGKYFIVNNNLYLSTAAILAGDPIKPGTNCTLTNLAAALNALNS